MAPHSTDGVATDVEPCNVHTPPSGLMLTNLEKPRGLKTKADSPSKRKRDSEDASPAAF